MVIFSVLCFSSACKFDLEVGQILFIYVDEGLPEFLTPTVWYDFISVNKSTKFKLMLETCSGIEYLLG